MPNEEREKKEGRERTWGLKEKEVKIKKGRKRENREKMSLSVTLDEFPPTVTPSPLIHDTPLIPAPSLSSFLPSDVPVPWPVPAVRIRAHAEV